MGTDSGSPAIASPAVRGALRALAALLDRGSLNNPYYRDRTVETFRLLRKAKEPFDGEPIAAYLVHLGLTIDKAREVERIASDIAAGRKLRGAPDAFKADIVDQWRRRGQGAETSD